MFKALFSASHLGIRTAVQFVIVITAGSIGMSVAASSASAGLDAIRNSDAPTSIVSGFMSLDQEDGATGAGFSATLSGLVPGDIRNFFVNVTNGGVAAQDLTISASDTGNTALTEDAIKGLQVSVSRCNVAWTGGTCSSGQNEILSSRAVQVINTGGGGAVATLVSGAITANQVVYLRITLTLPSSINETTTNGVKPGGSIQGLTDSLNWTLRVVQRTATTENF